MLRLPGLRPPLVALYMVVVGRRTWPGRQGALGDLWDALGRPQRAIGYYEAAIEAARESRRPAAVKRLRLWQFLLERSYARVGRARVEDPLFDVELTRQRDQRSRWRGLAGSYDVDVRHDGILVRGLLSRSKSHESVSLWIDETLVQRRQPSRNGIAGEFSIALRRGAVDLLPPRSRLEVRTESGGELGLRGRRGAVELAVPHGEGALLDALDSGRDVDKKGFVASTSSELAANQAQYLDLYHRVNEVLQREHGKDLFVLYGTLLGCIREGDFIRGDDDFDAGYVSSREGPYEVKQETLEIMRTLLRHGFDISVNERGRPFRVHDGGQHASGLHLDARPVWFRDGSFWLRKHFRAPGGIEDFLPTEEGRMGDETVLVPREAERFLAAYYGPGWRTPDPSFTNTPADVPLDLRRELARTQLSPHELQEFVEEIERLRANDPRVGRFVATALADLYPLPGR